MALELCDRVQSLLLNFRLHIHNDFVSPESVYLQQSSILQFVPIYRGTTYYYTNNNT